MHIIDYVTATYSHAADCIASILNDMLWPYMEIALAQLYECHDSQATSNDIKSVYTIKPGRARNDSTRGPLVFNIFRIVPVSFLVFNL